MKTQHSLTLALAIASASLVGFTPSTVSAEAIGVAVPKGINALKEEKWAEAQKIFADIVAEHGKQAKQIGDKFGNIYYWKGNAELKLASEAKSAGDVAKAREFYTLAKESLENCYKTGNKSGQNQSQVKSLLFKGQAMQQLEEYAGAIEMYQKFVNERAETDSFDPGMLNINMAICHFKQKPAKLAEGIPFFETALKNKERWGLADAPVVGTFQAFTEAVIEAKDEARLVDFVNQNRAVLMLRPFQMVQFTPFYQKLATDALKANMPNAAYTLFALVPGTKVALNDLQVLQNKLKDYPREGLRDGDVLIYKEKVNEWLAELSKKDRDGDPPEVVSLSALAFTHESSGYDLGALAAYEQLEMYFKGSDRREDNLYNLTRVAYSLGDIERTMKYGRAFKKAFPESDKADVTYTIMLTGLFQGGEYVECEELARETLVAFPEKSKINDLAMHMEGASLFYQGKYRESLPILEEHLKKYPESESRLATLYFVASNLGKVQDWARSASSLDSFIKKYPEAADNPYLPYALLDRADAAYNLEEDEVALKNVERLLEEFPEVSVIDAALIIKGKVEQEAGEYQKAAASYKEALDFAKKTGKTFGKTEALYHLVALLGKDEIDKKANPNMKEALPYYDEFWDKHAQSPYATQVAVAGMPAMVEAGRTEEGLKNLKDSIVRVAKQKNPAGLDRAINSYTTSYLAAKKAAGVDAVTAANDLKEHYYSFPVPNNDVRSRALLMFAVLGVYQEGYNAAIKAKDTELANQNQAQINALFKVMKADFPLDKLSNQILVSIADYLRAKTASPRQAIPYYEELLKRPDKSDYLAARFGIADVLGQVGSKQEMSKAIKDLKAIYAENKDSKNKEERSAANGAQNRIIAIYAKQGNYDKAIEEGLAYLDSKDSTYRSDVQQVLAESYDAKKDFTNAIKYYVIVSNGRDAIVAIPAKNRATELMWDYGVESGGKSRKQAAYEVAAIYIKSSRDWFDKNKSEIPTEAREAWLEIEARVKKWESSGQIKTLEQLAAEKG
ncbi:tetratricopeptide repeat protein [Rubritalea spongiae]|uniref:Tetratricopeptide repeat protein n=1 Tax=Rubritalea spongiae TaxID=430797 RepID=A0ABW5E256_9BACT